MPYVLFDTALGPCGVAWSQAGVTAVALPAPSDELADYLAGFAAETGEPDAVAISAIAGITALLDGGAPDLASIPVALEVSAFDLEVYEAVRTIPRGAVMTYGSIASVLGHPGAAQAVGGALGRNPVPVIIPCHRVLGAGREVGGFSAPGGVTTKQKILAIERVPGFGEPTLF